jgi:hypothetical protein
MKGHGRIVMVAGLLALIAAECSGNSSSSPPAPAPFAGINQSYMLSGGYRTLVLNGTAGSYISVIHGHKRIEPVGLTPTTITMGGVPHSYIASGNIIAAGGFVGFALNDVTNNAALGAGNYAFVYGQSNWGTVSISSNGTYVWCDSAAVSGSGCSGGAAAQTGYIIPKSLGTFQFSGQRGYYAFYVSGDTQAIFPVDPISLRLFAFNIPGAPPSGSFQSGQTLRNGLTTPSELIFAGNQVTIEGNGRFLSGGPFPVAFNSGVLQVTAGQCATGTCTGLYSHDLNLVYMPEVSGAIFFQSQG